MIRAAAPLAVAMLVVGGCGQLERLSENRAVQLAVAREGSLLTVHSSLWPRLETRFVLCPGPLPSLRPNLSEAESMAALVPPCADLGRHALGPREDAVLDLAAIPADEAAGLEAAADWHLVLLGLGGDHVLRDETVVDGGPIERP